MWDVGAGVACSMCRQVQAGGVCLLAAFMSTLMPSSGGSHVSSLRSCPNEPLWMCVTAPTQEAKENEKVKEKLTKWTLPLIHQSLDMFDLPRGTGDDSKGVCRDSQVLVTDARE